MTFCKKKKRAFTENEQYFIKGEKLVLNELNIFTIIMKIQKLSAAVDILIQEKDHGKDGTTKRIAKINKLYMNHSQLIIDEDEQKQFDEEMGPFMQFLDRNEKVAMKNMIRLKEQQR